MLIVKHNFTNLISTMKKYFTEEERKEACKETRKRFRERHLEMCRARDRETQKKKNSTPLGRAQYLIRNYKKMDRKNGFGDVIDFDAQWIIDNIFPKQCVHCGKEGWNKVGCNRIDNTKGHTKDNVEPCCRNCNSQLGGVYKKVLKPIDQIDKISGEVVKHWSCAREARKEGFAHCNAVANGKVNQDKGYIFKWA